MAQNIESPINKVSFDWENRKEILNQKKTVPQYLSAKDIYRIKKKMKIKVKI